MDLRIGIGYDIHKLETGRKLIIGGVEIPFEKGWVAHSDGDIFFHALTDALLGAVGYGDIGELFPDTENKWKDVESSVFLKEANRIIKENGYQILNIDAVIIMEKPKLKKYREEIIKNTAEMLGISENQIFLKGKTNEKLGEIGEGKAGISHVVVLLKKSP